MKQQQQQYYQHIQELVLTYLTPVLTEKLEAQQQFISQVRENLQSSTGKVDQQGTKIKVLENVRRIKARKELLAKSVNELKIIPEEVDLDEEFSEYFSHLQSYVDTLPGSLLEDQSLDRFQRFSEDPLRIKIGKSFKKWGLKLGWFPYRIVNWVRSKAGKSPIPLKMWKHQVPLRGMITYHFRDLMVEQLIEMVQTINRAIAASTYELYEVEARMNEKFAGLIGKESEPAQTTNPEQKDQREEIDKVLSTIRELTESIGGIAASRLERIQGIFERNYQLVGTIELPVKTFEDDGLSAVHKRAARSYQKTMDGWRNTLMVLSDRYNFDHELFNARFTIFEQYLFLIQKLESRISDKILIELDKISTFLASKESQLSQASTKDQDFKKTLNELRFETSRYLKRAIPGCIQLIREQKIPQLVENLEAKTKSEIAQLSETRSMVKNISYEHAIKESEIDQIAPKDLITFEALPQYLSKIQSVEKSVNDVVESTQQQLMEISNICDFNLETALAAMDDASQHDKAKAMSIEGIERAHSRLQDIVKELQDMIPEAEEIIRPAVDDFNEQIMALNEIDQVFDTQVRIAKAMAMERARALRREYLAKFQEFVPRLITYCKRRWLMIYKRYRDTSLKYGIGTSTKSLTAEVAGFLSDTDKNVKKLPFVYQRLFEISPLENVFFYEPRPRANLDLKKAYENWEVGHYGGTALIAEAGSGATTLVRFFLKELKSPYQTIWLNTDRQIYQEAQFFQFFSSQLDIEGIDSTESLVQYLNQLDGKRIIVVEDLEHFFLRRVNGFDCIRIFMELLTRTNDNIFWLMTINQHSFQYLLKTTGIDDCFSYNIDLRPLKPEQVTSLVMKRHRVSGFNLLFKAHKQDRKLAKFKKMNEEERQAYLQSEYISTLNNIVSGNASLALVYWLRSIIEIEGDVMHIRSLKGIDTSFLKNLSEEKTFTMNSMLLHDGISIQDHAKVFNQNPEKSKMTLLTLFDDGLVVQNESRFYINPLLFRQVLHLLKDKNIIH